jgi:hypothetical protein
VHQFPPRVKKGAPIQPLLAEGVGKIGGSVAHLEIRILSIQFFRGQIV